MPNPWTGKGNPYTRKEVIERLNATLKRREPIIAAGAGTGIDRKSTRLNSSHSQISYAVFCLKKNERPQRREEGDPRGSDVRHARRRRDARTAVRGSALRRRH